MSSVENLRRSSRYIIDDVISIAKNCIELQDIYIIINIFLFINMFLKVISIMFKINLILHV